jgi:hypothetical protein
MENDIASSTRIWNVAPACSSISPRLVHPQEQLSHESAPDRETHGQQQSPWGSRRAG